MNPISQIRSRLGVTQTVLAEALRVSQGNVSNYERGQNMPPETAKRLIAYGGERGVAITYEDIYGAVATHLSLPVAIDPGPQEQHRRRQSDQDPTTSKGCHDE